MGLQLPGGTIIDNTATPASASALIDHLETHLVTAGWSIISGAGTDAIKFESALTPEGARVRIVTGVSGSEVTLELRNAAETALGSTGNIRLDVDGVSTWRLMAHRYAFTLYEDTVPGALFSATGKKWCMAGTLHLPSHETATTTDVGFLYGDHRATNSNTKDFSFHTAPDYRFTSANFSVFHNASIWNVNNQGGTSTGGNHGVLMPSFKVMNSTVFSGNPTQEVKWTSGNRIGNDAILAWFHGNFSGGIKTAKGQLYGVFLLLDEVLTHEDFVDIDGNRYRCFTYQWGPDADELPYAMVWYVGPTP